MNIKKEILKLIDKRNVFTNCMSSNFKIWITKSPGRIVKHKKPRNGIKYGIFKRRVRSVIRSVDKRKMK
jgi:hypothetical protein